MPRLLTNEQILTMLAEGPKRIASLTEELEPSQLHSSSEEGVWSFNDILAHLRACSDKWGECIETILNEDMPTIRAVNPTTWIEETDYLEQPFHASLVAFTEQRQELLTLLEPLKPGAWTRKATVTGAGRPLERTVYYYAHWLATHERSHLKNIARMAKSAVSSS